MMNSGHGGNRSDKDANRRPERSASSRMKLRPHSGLLRALRNTAVSVLYQNTDLRVIWAQNVPPAWSPSSIVGMLDGDFLPPQAARAVIAAKRAVLSGPLADRLEICIPGVPGEREDQWFDLWIDADTRSDGQVRGIITTAVETTEQKRREQTLRVLLREVSHRSRNLLAIIQSIATQTGRYSSTVDGFLYALSRPAAVAGVVAGSGHLVQLARRRPRRPRARAGGALQRDTRRRRAPGRRKAVAQPECRAACRAGAA